VITIKTPEEIDILREGGRRLAAILNILARQVEPRMYTDALNGIADKLIRSDGDKPAFLGYTPDGAARPYPATLCVSINDEIVHGIPNEESERLKDGDIVGLDLGLIHNGLIVDSAITVPVGKIDESAIKLIKTTKDALLAGINAARAGNTVGDIGHAIEQIAKKDGYGVVKELGGHGVGYKVHEEPHIPNFGNKGEGPELKAGMVLALEPMFNEGKENIKLAPDGYTFKTEDGLRSAHFEHTIVITDGKAEIITKE